MSLSQIFRPGLRMKRFAVDSIAHTLFYGIIGGIVALSLGIEIEIYITMSIIGTAIQLLSGGLFGRFLDFLRNIANA